MQSQKNDVIPSLGRVVEHPPGRLDDHLAERHVGLRLSFDQAIKILKICCVMLAIMVHELFLGEERFHGIHRERQRRLLERHFGVSCFDGGRWFGSRETTGNP